MTVVLIFYILDTCNTYSNFANQFKGGLLQWKKYAKELISDS